MSKKTCQISISNAMDSKEFRRLMSEHSIAIISKEHKNDKDIYTVEKNPKKVEGIMIYSSCSWEFE